MTMMMMMIRKQKMMKTKTSAREKRLRSWLSWIKMRMMIRAVAHLMRIKPQES